MLMFHDVDILFVAFIWKFRFFLGAYAQMTSTSIFPEDSVSARASQARQAGHAARARH